MKKKEFINLIFKNIIFLVFFVCILELGYRLIYFSKSCFLGSYCNFSLFSLKPYDKNLFIGLTQKDLILGYRLSENFSKTINKVNWNNVKVSTNSNGLRNSSDFYLDKKYNILTVGDSYAFGDQVSDHETWQSCLNKKFKNINFLNGGVFGYSTSQAILHADNLSSKIKPDKLIVQVLVGYDFQRDQYSIKNGFPKPYISRELNGKTDIINIKSFDIPNTKFTNKKSISFVDHFLINFSFLSKMKINFITDLYSQSYLKITSSIYKKELNASTIEEIIRWTTKKSKELDPNVIWLLQYTSILNKEVINERAFLKEILRKEDIKFIDTFDYVHGFLKPHNKKIWNDHHTPYGNKIVCQVIFDSTLIND